MNIRKKIKQFFCTHSYKEYSSEFYPGDDKLKSFTLVCEKCDKLITFDRDKLDFSGDNKYNHIMYKLRAGFVFASMIMNDNDYLTGNYQNDFYSIIDEALEEQEALNQ